MWINMKIKNDFILRKVADSYVVVPVGKMTLDFNGIINLNETGAFLFGELQKGADREELIQKLLAEYDVTPEKAANDIDIFIQKAKDADLAGNAGRRPLADIYGSNERRL